MLRTRGYVAIVCALMAYSIVVSIAHGGDLNPPPGVIGATDRQILSQATTPTPHTIATSGSYKLTSDLVFAGGAEALRITANDVTIDLNGFSIDGQSLPGDGIIVAAERCTIRNGCIRGFASGTGIKISAGTPDESAVVESVTVSGCTVGIRVRGRVSGCTVEEALGTGIDVKEGSTVENSRVRAALTGIVANGGCTISVCAVRNTTSSGITASNGSTVDRCAVSDCDSLGIVVAGGAVATACTVIECSLGYRVDFATVIECSVRSSTGFGFDVDYGTVDRCFVGDTQGSGIRAKSACVISNNTCSSVALASGAGIEVPGNFPYYGQQNLIHHNTVNGSGGNCFWVKYTQNILYANSAAFPGGGVNYSIVGGNDVAPIVAPAASTSANDNLSH